MAKMCPMSGCRACAGLCVHDKLMIAMGALLALGATAHWVLRLF